MYQRTHANEENARRYQNQNLNQNRENSGGRPQYNREHEYGRKYTSKNRGPVNSRFGGPHRESSNMRRHSMAKHYAPEKRKRLTKPSKRSQPLLSKTITNEKHFLLKTSSDESETSRNNFRKTFKVN